MQVRTLHLNVKYQYLISAEKTQHTFHTFLTGSKSGYFVFFP